MIKILTFEKMVKIPSTRVDKHFLQELISIVEDERKRFISEQTRMIGEKVSERLTNIIKMQEDKQQKKLTVEEKNELKDKLLKEYNEIYFERPPFICNYVLNTPDETITFENLEDLFGEISFPPKIRKFSIVFKPFSKSSENVIIQVRLNQESPWWDEAIISGPNKTKVSEFEKKIHEVFSNHLTSYHWFHKFDIKRLFMPIGFIFFLPFLVLGDNLSNLQKIAYISALIVLGFLMFSVIKLYPYYQFDLNIAEIQTRENWRKGLKIVSGLLGAILIGVGLIYFQSFIQ